MPVLKGTYVERTVVGEGVRVAIKDWDNNKQQVRRSCNQYAVLNQILETLRNTIQRAYNELASEG